MSLQAFVNGTIYAPELLRNHVLLVKDDSILDVVTVEQFQNHPEKDNFTLVDLEGANVSPGFIDLQLNGCGGVNFSEDETLITPATLRTMLATNLKHGCTSYLPTFITNPYHLRECAIQAYRDLIKESPELATAVPGLHIEGPHISLARKGTHNPNFIKPATQADIDLYVRNADAIKMLTLAPEENDPALVKQLIDKGIVISFGHTNSDYKTAKDFVKLGVTSATHMYNAMTAIPNGRSAGVVLAVLGSPTINMGIIADGIHVSWPLVEFTLRSKGKNAYVVTDAVAPAGTDIEEFIFANKVIKVINQGCYDADGCLSGSAITMDSSLQRLQENTSFSKEELIAFVTEHPARAIHMQDTIGVLKAGAKAHLAVFDDNFNIKATYLNGNKVYSA